MKKIYTKSVFEFNPKTGLYEVNENDSHYHYISDDAPIAEMKGGSSQGQVQNTAPWQPQQKYLLDAFNQAQQAFGSDNPTLQAAQQDELARATNGSPVNAAASGMLQKTLNGDYLYGGSGFNAALDAAKNSIIPEVNSQFEKYGRGGSGLNATAETSAIGDAFAKQYGQERENQMRAGAMAPTIANQDYVDLAARTDVGNSRRNAIMEYLKAIGGGYGSQVNQPDQGLSGWLRMLAGAGGGALMGTTFGPWGAAAGGGLGLLGSLR